MISAIINGDDFGISEDVNRAIAECFGKGLLTSTTLMVNMPYAFDAVEIARASGFEDRVGLHLNLTSGTPLTAEIRELRRFCNNDGTFNASFQKRLPTRLYIDERERQAVSIEIEAQIRKYLGFGLKNRHIDSHHHVHTDYSIMRELLPLLKKYGFRSIRLSRNIHGKINPLKRFYKNYFNGLIKKSGLYTTDFFGSYLDLRKFGKEVPDNALVEIMLHPMYNEKGVLTDTSTPMEEVLRLISSLKTEKACWK